MSETSHSEPTYQAPQFDDGNFIGNYFRTVIRILGHPSAFFRSMPVAGGVGAPLAFALVNHWLGSALSFLWKQWLGNGMASYFNRAFRIFQDVSDVDAPGRASQVLATQQRMMHWMWGTGSILLDPFLTLFHIAFVSLLVFIGARLFVPAPASLYEGMGPSLDPHASHDSHPEATSHAAPVNATRLVVTYESALRIVCFGLTPAILAGLPIFGGAVATIFALIVTVIGARVVYRVSTMRAVVIALFPKLLFLALLLAGFALVALFLVQLFTSAV